MLGLHQPGWARRLAFVAIAALAVVAFDALPAGAVLRTGPNPAHGLARGASTQLVLSATGPGESVNGFIANPNSGFDPTHGYPTTIPPPNFSAKDEGFAGVIYGTPVGGGAQMDLYCIDINTDTYIGNGYALGTWDEANVPHVGYVARILDEYYPNTNQPSSLTNVDQRAAAAVQAAVWFFSDSYVLSTSESIESTVASIVNKVISEGPLTPASATQPDHHARPPERAGRFGPRAVHSALDRHHDRDVDGREHVLQLHRYQPHRAGGGGA